MYKILPILLLLGLFLNLSACMLSNLESRGLVPDLVKLANNNNKKVTLSIENKHSKTLGYQFFLLIFPFGRIAHQNLEQVTLQVLYRELALKGFSPQILTKDKNSSDDSVVVKIIDFDLNAYDLIFTRRVVCNIKLETTVNNQYNFKTETRYSEFKSMPFKPELEHLLERTLTQAIDDLNEQLLNYL